MLGFHCSQKHPARGRAIACFPPVAACQQKVIHILLTDTCGWLGDKILAFCFWREPEVNAGLHAQILTHALFNQRTQPQTCVHTNLFGILLINNLVIHLFGEAVN